MAAHRALAYKCKAQVMHSEVFAFRGCSKTMQAAYLDGILSFQGVLPMWTLFFSCRQGKTHVYSMQPVHFT